MTLKRNVLYNFFKLAIKILLKPNILSKSKVYCPLLFLLLIMDIFKTIKIRNQDIQCNMVEHVCVQKNVYSHITIVVPIINFCVTQNLQQITTIFTLKILQ